MKGSIKKVGILYHPLKDEAVALGQEIEKSLTELGVPAWSCSAWESEVARSKVADSDLIISIGGDGTILRAAQAVAPSPIPIIGINLGVLGFMTELTVEESRDMLQRVIAGEGWMDDRSLLEARVLLPGQKRAVRYYALNDVVVARGAVARVVLVETEIDKQPLTTYKADGVIIATATGSTGYALAAGGPVLHPHAMEMVLLPIMPHLTASFRLVLRPDSEVKLKLKTMHTATLSIDGHTNIPVENDTVVTVKRSSHTLKFLRIHPRDSFYATLEQRLKGKH